MASVRKTSGPSAARGVVYDFQKRAAVTTVDRVDRADSAGITGSARELSAALRIVEESDEVRAEKVRVLREAIANGTYNPDPREVAKKLVERGFQ